MNDFILSQVGVVSWPNVQEGGDAEPENAELFGEGSARFRLPGALARLRSRGREHLLRGDRLRSTSARQAQRSSNFLMSDTYSRLFID